MIEDLIKKIIEDNNKILAYQTSVELSHNLFAYIGIARLEAELEKIKNSGEKYVSLAELFSSVMRNNLAKENKEVIHSYHELLPRLDHYTKLIEKLNDKQ